MTARDAIHDAVRSALVKDGWTITADPYTIQYKEIKLFADLAAEQPMAAERKNELIIVEIKSFLGASRMRDLELAIGQYQLYRAYLDLTEPDRALYLAVRDITYFDFLQMDSIRIVLEKLRIKLLAINIERAEVTQWTR